jgi:hypothetical protein
MAGTAATDLRFIIETLRENSEHGNFNSLFLETGSFSLYRFGGNPPGSSKVFSIQLHKTNDLFSIGFNLDGAEIYARIEIIPNNSQLHLYYCPDSPQSFEFSIITKYSDITITLWMNYPLAIIPKSWQIIRQEFEVLKEKEERAIAQGTPFEWPPGTREPYKTSFRLQRRFL